jgi:hypothetical protein
LHGLKKGQQQEMEQQQGERQLLLLSAGQSSSCHTCPGPQLVLQGTQRQRPPLAAAAARQAPLLPPAVPACPCSLWHCRGLLSRLLLLLLLLLMPC